MKLLPSGITQIENESNGVFGFPLPRHKMRSYNVVAFAKKLVTFNVKDALDGQIGNKSTTHILES